MNKNSKKDCFGYVSKGHCAILKECICESGPCSFYKTKDEYRKGLEKYPPACAEISNAAKRVQRVADL